MTQPDKWDEYAEKLAERAENYEVGHGFSFEFVMTELATALRSAYAEGEKAGMERAIAIAGEFEEARKQDAENETYPIDRVALQEQARGAWFIAKRIRAAKETNK